MWSPKTVFNGSYPTGCTESPMAGSGFCKLHSNVVKRAGYPTELRAFIARCGGNSKTFTKEAKKKMKKVLEDISSRNPCLETTSTPEDTQGTSHFLQNPNIATEDNFKMVGSASNECRKDVGELKRLHSYSRGIEQIVGGGGIIEYFSVIFGSEGPAQISIVTLKYLELKMAGKSLQDFSEFYLSYDNMPGSLFFGKKDEIVHLLIRLSWR